MKCFFGLDVSQDSCAVCVLEEDGTILFEGECATDLDMIVDTISEHAGLVERIVHESGPLSI